jgi:hypothetical protein
MSRFMPWGKAISVWLLPLGFIVMAFAAYAGARLRANGEIGKRKGIDAPGERRFSRPDSLLARDWPRILDQLRRAALEGIAA